MPHYFDGCTLPGGLGRGPDDDYESPEEVDRCECGEPATIKCGAERFCAECNDEIDADAAERVAAMAKEGAD